MARRGENIYKRKDGRYEGRYIRGRRLDGKPIFGYIYSYTYFEVKSALILAKAASNKLKPVCIIGRGSLAEFLCFWLQRIMRDRIKASTYAQYHARVERHIIPALGKVSVSELNAEQAQTFVDELSRKGLSPTTVANITRLLRCAMNRAVKLRITEVNPCDGLILPKAAGGRRRALERGEQIALERQAENVGGSVKLAVFISLYAGLRIGEACSLHWRDIDLFSGTLTVRGTLQRIKSFDGASKTVIVEGAPKSIRSYRSIPMPAGLTDKLRELGGAMPGHFYVLTGSEKPLEPRTLRARYKRAAEKIGLSVPFHTLRHTFATRCLEYNFDVQTLSELLGHSSACVTMNVYAHSVLEHKCMLAKRVHILSDYCEPSNKPSGLCAVY